MINEREISRVLDQPLRDVDGREVGDVKDVLQDEATGRPEWLGVQIGPMGGRETFVPVSGAEVVADHVECLYEKDFIKHAPGIDVDADGHISASEEQRLDDYYSIERGRRQGPAGDYARTRPSEEELRVTKETWESGRARLHKYEGPKNGR